MLTTPQGTLEPSGLFSPFDLASRPAVIAAVSGGSDSLALLLLLKSHFDRFSPPTRLVAATVDHALRPESAAEAAAVARLCAGLGVPHRVLTWTGDKPRTGIAAAAREARHRLLAEAAAAEGTDLVLTGHTANDQAETVLMRQARESLPDGGRGAAGMAQATLFNGKTWLVRPLLGVRRNALRDLLRQKRIAWIDDPTNADQRYERPRVRKRLCEVDGEEATAQALKDGAAAAGRRASSSERAAGLIREHARSPAPGLLRLRSDFFRAEHAEPAVLALRILLAVAGGTPHLPDAARSEALFARLAAGSPFRAVLSRALIDRRKADAFLLREARGLPAVHEVRGGTVWDGRYCIVAPSLDARREPPDMPARESQECGTVAPESLLRLAAAAQPALPPQWSAVPVLAPWATYLPSFDIAVARAAAELIGAPPITAPPFREHD